MRIYRYWQEETGEIEIDGRSLAIRGYGKSNNSIEEARQDAAARLRKVQRKIAGKAVVKEDYSADIREEIVHEIDAHNVITRNRYGARVLNTDSTTILDIDHHRKSFLEALGFKRREDKAAIVEDLAILVARPEYQALGFRVYETAKGVRVIVIGRYFDPNATDGHSLMERSNTDPVFAMLCRKQACYRARLTPKPYRIKQKGIRYRWPMKQEDLQRAQSWVNEYEIRSANFAVCRYLKTLGSQTLLSEIVALHDDATKADSGQPLA